MAGWDSNGSAGVPARRAARGAWSRAARMFADLWIPAFAGMTGEGENGGVESGNGGAEIWEWRRGFVRIRIGGICRISFRPACAFPHIRNSRQAEYGQALAC